MRAIVVTRFGGPEVLELVEAPEPMPGDGQVIAQVLAAGVNYADTHQTEDSYLSKQTLPLYPGSEVVARLDDGTRVLAFVPAGGYAERIALDPSRAVPLPDAVTNGAALSLLVQGLTAWHLLRTSTHLAKGESILINAAAGGVGSLAVQLARIWGAGQIIGTASSASKRELVLSLGADAALDPALAELDGGKPFTTALREANDGRGVDIVLEMTGGPLFDVSLRALAMLGRLAYFGNASRVAPTPVDPGMLLARSTSVVGFWLMPVLSTPNGLAAPLTELLTMVADGQLKPVITPGYPLADAHVAHEDILARKTTGKVWLDLT